MSHQDDSSIHLSSANGEDLLLEDASELSKEGDETVVAADGSGNSLTLLEEYSLRKGKATPGEFVIAFLCAAASLAFASLIYLNTV